MEDRETEIEKAQVLLHTAQSWAEDQQEHTPLRLLLDGGSQRTFVQRSVSMRLRLKALGEEELNIFTFGGSAVAKHEMASGGAMAEKPIE